MCYWCHMLLVMFQMLSHGCFCVGSRDLIWFWFCRNTCFWKYALAWFQDIHLCGLICLNIQLTIRLYFRGDWHYLLFWNMLQLLLSFRSNSSSIQYCDIMPSLFCCFGNILQNIRWPTLIYYWVLEIYLSFWLRLNLQNWEYWLF